MKASAAEGNPTRRRGLWGLAGVGVFALYLAAVTFFRLHPHYSFDWDSSERALDALLLRDFLVTALRGEIRRGADVAAFVRAFQDTYTAGGGLVTWPPLQAGLLVPWTAALGPTPLAFALFNLPLAAALFAAVRRLGRELFPSGGAGLALLFLFAYPPTWLSIPNLNLRVGEAVAEALLALWVLRYARHGSRRDLLRADAAFALGTLYVEQTGVLLPVLAVLPWVARRRYLPDDAPASRPPWVPHALLLAFPFLMLTVLSLAARAVGLPDYFEGILYRKGIHLGSTYPVTWETLTTGLNGYFRLATTVNPGGPTFGPWWQKILFNIGSLLYFWKAFALGLGALCLARRRSQGSDVPGTPVAARPAGWPARPPADWGWVAALAAVQLLFLARAGALPSYLLPPWVLIAALAGCAVQDGLAGRRRYHLLVCFGMTGLILFDAGLTAQAFHTGRFSNGPVFSPVSTVLALREDLAVGERAEVFVHTTAAKTVGLALYPFNQDRRVRLRAFSDNPVPAIRAGLSTSTDGIYLLGYGQSLWGLPDANALRTDLSRVGVAARMIPVPPTRCSVCESLVILKVTRPRGGPTSNPSPGGYIRENRGGILR